MRWITGNRKLVKKVTKRYRGDLYWNRLRYLYGGLRRDPEIGDLVHGHDGLNHVITDVNLYMTPVQLHYSTGAVVGHRLAVEAYYGNGSCATDIWGIGEGYMPPQPREYVVARLKGVFQQWSGQDEWGFLSRLQDQGISDISEIESKVDERGVLIP